MRTYRVISGDGHVETPPESWVKYVPAKWRDRAPRLITVPEGEAWMVEGKDLLFNGKNINAGKLARIMGESYFDEGGIPATGAGPAEQRLREQDLDGLDAEVLFPPVYATTFIEGIADRAAYFSMVQAYNTYLAEDYCSVAPDRLIGNAVIPVSGIDDAVAELKRVKGLGLRSVSLHQFPNGGGTPKPEDDRFWEAALSDKVALSPHFGFGERLTGLGSAGDRRAKRDACGEFSKTAGDHRPINSMVQLMVDGVLDRFPELRFYFAESEVSWLPTAMARVDKNYKTFGGWFGVELKKLPSEYMRENFYFGMVTDPFVTQMQHILPMDRLMWGSDFPHAAGTFPRSAEALKDGEAGVPEEWSRQILLETPADFFGLDLERPLTPTPA